MNSEQIWWLQNDYRNIGDLTETPKGAMKMAPPTQNATLADLTVCQSNDLFFPDV